MGVAAQLGRRVVPGLLALALAPGCFWVTTKDEGNLLRKDVTSLQERMAKQEESVDERVKKLDESLDKATKLLTRNSADVGTDVEKLGKDQSQLNGQVQDMQRQVESMRAEVDALKQENAKLRSDYEARLAAAEQRLASFDGAPTGKPGGTPPGGGEKPPGGSVTSPGGSVLDKDALFARAKKSLDDGQLTDARRDYTDFLKRFGKDSKADDAQYALGEIFYREKAYEKAIGEFQKVIDGFADGDQADRALFRAGEASIEMKWCVDARAYFGVLVQKYPKSALVKNAKAKLDFIKKNAKKKDVCST
jgi:TolA-binding protein